MNQPKVSIITPTYNRDNLILKTIQSIRSQIYVNWECLIIDDFSTDNTRNQIQRFSEKDRRIKYFPNERAKGAQGARNTGLKYAKGNFINFFDSDDIMYPQYLEKKVSFIEANPMSEVVVSFAHIYNLHSEVIGTFCPIARGNVHQDILSGGVYVDTNSALIKSETIRSHGLLDENCPAYQEWDLHICLSKIANYGFIPEFLTGYYQRNQDTISSDKKRDLLGRLFIYSKHKADFIEQIGVASYKSRFMKLVNEAEKLNIDIRNHYELGKVELEILRRRKFSIIKNWIKRII